MFVSVLLNWIDLFSASLIAAATMVFTGCCDRRSLFSEIDWSIIATLGGLLIMGEAVILSGLSDELARIIIDTMPSQNSYTYIAMFFIEFISIQYIIGKSGRIVDFTCGC